MESKENSELIFGSRVKELRIKKNLTQPQLGELVGLSKQAISDIEVGRRMTGVDKAIKIASIFGTTVEYLAGYIDDPAPLRYKRDHGPITLREESDE